MRYFINKESGSSRQIGDYTPSALHECLTACKVVGKELIDNVEVDKTELIWLEIDQATFEQIDVSIKWSVAEQKFVPYTPPKPIEKTKEEKYDELVNSKMQARGYTYDKQIAILCNGQDTTEHKKEYDAMQLVRQECKAEARKEIKL